MYAFDIDVMWGSKDTQKLCSKKSETGFLTIIWGAGGKTQKNMCFPYQGDYSDSSMGHPRCKFLQHAPPPVLVRCGPSCVFCNTSHFGQKYFLNFFQVFWGAQLGGDWWGVEGRIWVCELKLGAPLVD